MVPPAGVPPCLRQGSEASAFGLSPQYATGMLRPHGLRSASGTYHRHVADDGEREGYLKLLHELARNWRTNVEIGKDDHIVLLSTCSAGYTNAREILVGKICNERFENPFVKIPNLGTGVDTQEGWLGVPYWCWLALGVLAVFCVIIVRVRKATRVVK